MYELRINNKFYSFDTVKEAYLYYLDNFATENQPFVVTEPYKKIDGKDLRECSDNEALIGCIFDNVFSPSHHLYKVVKRKDGYEVYKTLQG